MWLYPVWILEENKKFVIYADPKAKDLFKEEKEMLPNELNINWTVYIKK
jgi:hypothetical protein